MRFKVISLAAAALFLGACGGTANNANNSRANVTNLGANNANTGAIVVNSNANTSSNRWHANVTREEYELQFSDIFDQIVAYANGGPINVVNPEALLHARRDA